MVIAEHDDCWSFETDEHGMHMGYPDALQALAAGLQAYDPAIARTDIPIADVRGALKPRLRLVPRGEDRVGE